MPASGPVTIDTPLGPDALFFLGMRGVETLGRPFQYIVDLVSDDSNIKLSGLLGQPITVHLEIGDGSKRHFNGYVTSVDFMEAARPRAAYRAVVRPWLWLLTNTFNCRIFQNRTVPDIVKQIFRDQGYTDFEESLSGDYPKSDYVVQYRESDFDFISRLLEHAGIYYYFRHTASSHTLVLADSYTAHKKTPGCETLPYQPPDQHRRQLVATVERWQLTQRVTSGAVTLNDFDFERPNAKLLAKVSAPKEHAVASSEVYDYPGDYRVRSDGEGQARIRLEQRHEQYEQVRGRSNARGLAVGALFSLTDHPRDDQNREYLVTHGELSISGHDLQSGRTTAELTFETQFTAIDSHVPFRSAPSTKKPVVEGPQTAIVVGKSGEEIWTDKYGRVKVQFHWDRLGERDENSSCWVRVAQVWAGSHWGAMHIPRIGQEVIVDFLEGDPDRPIITGRVYNASNMPPYDLPGNQTRSGVKSRTTKGGGAPNANEIRFEDRKGQEEFFVQAEKDLNSVVKNSETRSVGANRSVSIGANESLTVGKNRTAKVGVNETITIGADETMSVGGNEMRSITGNETVSITGNQTESVTGNDTTTVTGSQSLTVMASRTHAVLVAETITVGAVQAVTVGSRAKTVATTEVVTIGAGLTETVGGSVTLTVGGGRKESVGGDETVSIAGGQTVTVGKKGSLSVSQKLVIDAGEEIILKAGDASITLSKNGDIVLKGKNLTSDASGKVSLKAASDLTLKGSKISQN